MCMCLKVHTSLGSHKTLSTGLKFILILYMKLVAHLSDVDHSNFKF